MQDAAGNPYVGTAVTTEDLGTANQVQKAMSQVLDSSGNVTQTKMYNYGNLTTPARIYTHTYLGGAYASRYILDRLVS